MTIAQSITSDAVSNFVASLIPSIGDILTVANTVFIGDSYANAIAANATNRDAFTDALIAAGVTSATTGDAAQAGANLTENDTDNLWNLSTSSKGALYTSLIDPFPNKNTYNIGVLSIGTNDRSFLPNPTTEEEYKIGNQQLLNQLRNDFPNIDFWIYYPAYRDNLSGNDEGMNIVRRVQREMAEENSDVYIIAESYDYTSQDDLHINDASETLYAQDRIAGRIANVGGLSSETLLSPVVTGIAVTTEGLEFTIQHKDGDDITVPASTSPEMFFATTEFSQNSGRLDPTGYTAKRLAANKIRFDCGALTGVSTCGIGGAMTGLATNNVAPIVPLDNSTEGLPIQTCSFVPTDADVIRTLGNIQAGMTADHIKTYNTGVEVDTIQSVNGRVFDRTFTTYPDFDATAFDGDGGVKMTATTNRLKTTLVLQQDMMAFGGCEIPVSPAANCEIFAFGSNGTGGIGNNTLQVFSSSGVLRWNLNQAGAGINIDSGNDYRGVRIAYLVDFHSDDDVDFHFYTEEYGLVTLLSQDIRDNYAGYNTFLMGGGNTIHRDLWLKYGDSATLNEGTTIYDILNELQSRINITQFPTSADYPFLSPSLTLWNDASNAESITEAAGLVSVWGDRSGRRFDLTQPTGTNQPTTGTRTVNGSNAIDFNGSDNFMIGDDGLHDIAEDENTLIIAFQSDSTSTKQRLLSGSAFGGTKWGLIRESDGDITGFSNQSFNEVTVAGVNDTNPHIAVLRSTGSLLFVSIDGGEEIAGQATSSIIDKIHMGANPNGNGEFFDGLMVDCTVFRKYLDDDALNTQLTNLGTKIGITPSTVSTNFASLGGQSNASRRFSNAADDYALFFDAGNNQYADGSTSGVALLKANNATNYWYNNDTNTIEGTAWDTYTASIEGNNITSVVWDHGESDFVGLFFSQYETGVTNVLTEINTLTGSDIYVTIPFGTSNTGTAFDGTTQDQSAQGIREIYFDIINALSFVKKGAERFDLPKADAQHLTSAAYVDLAERDAYIAGGGSAGPEVSGVSRSGTTVTVTVTHGDGTDFTPTTGIEGFYFTDDGTEIAINSAVRTNATTITLTLASAPTGDEILYYYFGDRGVGVTDEANLVIDNSSGTTGLSKGMPLRAMKWEL